MILDEESSDRTAAEVDLSETPGHGGSVEPATPVGASDPGMPTGNILLNTGPVTSPRTLLVQTAIVIGSALLVGTIVFLAVRAAVGGDEDEDVQDESALIDPGPSGDEIPGVDNSSRSGSRRDTPGEGEPFPDEDAEEAAADADTEDAPAGPITSEDDSSEPLGTDDDLAASAETNPSTSVVSPTSVPLIVGPSDTGLLQPTTTTSIPLGPITSVLTIPTPTVAIPTVPVPTTTATSRGPSTTTGGTIASTTQATATTIQTTSSTDGPSSTISITTTSTATSSSSSTTTSTSSTTTAPPPVGALIVSPADGDSRPWDSATRFQAEPVVNADKYCWTIDSGAGERQACGSDVIFDLPAAPVGVLPGPMTVHAEALGVGGEVLAQDQISIDLLVGDVAASPIGGADLSLGDDLQLRSAEVESATRYCWTISQGATSTGEICVVDTLFTLAADDIRLDGIDVGTTRIRFTAYRGLHLVGAEEVLVTLS